LNTPQAELRPLASLVCSGACSFEWTKRGLLDDPTYLGWRHRRIGAAYDDFIDRFVKAERTELPDVLVQWGRTSPPRTPCPS
jgi:hypothetical protein